MKFEITYTFEDYYRALKIYWRVMRLHWYFFILGSLIFLVAYLTNSGFFLYIVSVVIAFAPFTLLYLQSKSVFANNRLLRQKLNYEITPDFIRLITEEMDQTLKWKAISKIAVEKDVIVLFVYPQLLKYFPRKYFTQTDWEKLCEIVQAGYESSKKVG